MEMNGQIHAPLALFAGKEPQVPNGYETRLTPETVWTLWEREKPLPLSPR
jgi:hypothetical protein